MTRSPRDLSPAIGSCASYRRAVIAGVFGWSFLLCSVLVFLALQGVRTLFLRLDVESSGPSNSVAEVRWTARQRPLNNSDSISVTVGSGRTHLSIPIPVEVDMLQILPAAAGTSQWQIHEIALATPFATLHRWNGDNGFTGWNANTAVDRFAREANALSVHASRPDAILQIDDIQPLRDGQRRRRHLALALLVGALAGALHALAFHLFARRRNLLAAVVVVPEPKSATDARALAPGILKLAVVLGTALALVLVWILGRHFRPAADRAVFADAGEYSLSVVDHLGQRLSERDGSLRLQLDPFGLFRNAPGLATRRFHTDARGYRVSSEPRPDLPKILILGGSAAFGFGLDADWQVFTAQMAGQDHRHEYLNAAVVGYLSGQELAELVHHTSDLALSAVVVVDGWNDVYGPMLAATRFPANGLSAGFNWDVFQTLEHRLRLYTLGGATESGPNPPREPTADLQERIIASYLANIRVLQQLCAARGTSLLVAFQPWVAARTNPPPSEAAALKDWNSAVPERTDPALFETFRSRAGSVLQREQIEILDLNQAPQFRVGTGPLFLDIVHPSAEGHAVMATLVQQRLREMATRAQKLVK